MRETFQRRLNVMCAPPCKPMSSGETLLSCLRIEIDTAAVARHWNAAREGVLAQLRAKSAAPLEPFALYPDSLEAIRICTGDALMKCLYCPNRLDRIECSA